MGSSQATVWVFALVLSSPLAAREYLPHHSASRSHRDSLLMCLEHLFPLLPSGLPGLFLTLLPSPTSSVLPLLTQTPQGAANMATGLSRALQWVGWSWLEQDSPGLFLQRLPSSPHAWAPTAGTPSYESDI